MRTHPRPLRRNIVSYHKAKLLLARLYQPATYKILNPIETQRKNDISMRVIGVALTHVVLRSSDLGGRQAPKHVNIARSVLMAHPLQRAQKNEIIISCKSIKKVVSCK